VLKKRGPCTFYIVWRRTPMRDACTFDMLAHATCAHTTGTHGCFSWKTRHAPTMWDACPLSNKNNAAHVQEFGTRARFLSNCDIRLTKLGACAVIVLQHATRSQITRSSARRSQEAQNTPMWDAWALSGHNERDTCPYKSNTRVFL